MGNQNSEEHEQLRRDPATGSAAELERRGAWKLSYAELRQLPHNDLIKTYDLFLLAGTQHLGAEDYLQEIERRAGERQANILIGLTGAIVVLTLAFLYLTTQL